jgi:hypothetical protein
VAIQESLAQESLARSRLARRALDRHVADSSSKDGRLPAALRLLVTTDQFERTLQTCAVERANEASEKPAAVVAAGSDCFTLSAGSERRDNRKRWVANVR